MQTDGDGLCWFWSHVHGSAWTHDVVEQARRLVVDPHLCAEGQVVHDVDMIFDWYVPAGHGLGHWVGSKHE